MNRIPFVRAALAAGLGSLLLAACGGGDHAVVEAPPAAANEVPASALASPTAYTEYAKALAAQPRDRDAPVDVNRVTMPPTSETAAPQPL